MLERRLLVTFGAAVTLVGSFLPWLRSGSRNRTSYELFAIVARLGFSPDGVIGWAIRLWPLVPLLLVLSSIGPWLHVRQRTLRRVGAGIAVFAGTYAAATALAVILAPSAGLVSIRIGPWVTLVGALALVVTAVLTVPRRTDAPSGPVA